MRHGALLNAGRTLLVVVDMQDAFLNPIWEKERVLSNVQLLAQAAKILGVPALPTVQYAERMGGVTEQITEVLPEGVRPIDKLCFSCAGQPEFLSAVKSSGRNQLLLCGIEAHICVCQTALDLIAIGFHVHIAADAVSSRSEQTWQLGLRKMEQAGAIITSTEGAIYEMMYQAGTPQFKEVLQLVKARSQ